MRPRAHFGAERSPSSAALQRRLPHRRRRGFGIGRPGREASSERDAFSEREAIGVGIRARFGETDAREVRVGGRWKGGDGSRSCSRDCRRGP